MDIHSLIQQLEYPLLLQHAHAEALARYTRTDDVIEPKAAVACLASKWRAIDGVKMLRIGRFENVPDFRAQVLHTAT